MCVWIRYNILLLSYFEYLVCVGNCNFVVLLIFKVERFFLEKFVLLVIGVEMFGCLDCCGIGDWWFGRSGGVRKRVIDMMDYEF